MALPVASESTETKSIFTRSGRRQQKKYPPTTKIILTIFSVISILTTGTPRCRLFATAFCAKLQYQHTVHLPILAPVLFSRQTSANTGSSSISRSMASSSLSFEDFLVSQKSIPTAAIDHVVVGNSAGDADSIISALTYGFLESKTPIVSISKNDLETQRPEVAFLFRTLGLDQTITDSLRFIDDPLFTAATTETKKKLTLVDHNRAEEIFQSNSNNNNNIDWEVVEILDHHHDEGKHTDSCTGDRRNIAFANDKALVASTCTLVAERLKALQTENSKKYPATLSTLLLGTILLDSVNMIPEAGKGTPRDAAAIQDLLKQTDWTSMKNSNQGAVEAWWEKNSEHPDTTRMFDSLQAAKFDPTFWNGLSVIDALRLDYKRFSATSAQKKPVVFGASAVLLPMQDFLSKTTTGETSHGVTQNIATYMTEHASVDFLVILFFFQCPKSGDNRRQLMFCEINRANDNESVDDQKEDMTGLIDFLVDDGTLALQEVHGDSNESVCSVAGNQQITVRLFEQTNAKASRKQVAPLLMKYFETQ